MDFVTIHPLDNVKVSLQDGHKYALRRIAEGEAVIKYGFPIGIASQEIPKGCHVHTHNVKTALSGLLEYSYRPALHPPAAAVPSEVDAFERANGEIGIRNDIWIINTVGCVNKLAEQLSRKTGALCFPHPYGCSQLGEDHRITQQTLCGLIRHPNAGGVLVLGLGCESNHIAAVKKALGTYDQRRIRFLNAQDCTDELAEGAAILSQLQKQAQGDRRTPVPASRLKIGLKCGGSDGLSGITANPLVGRVTDRLIAMGGAAALTEVPEMFGAERLLMNRCVNRAVFEQTVRLINRYKQYFLAHHQPVSENPSPGNKAGGITTLEEKSLGCVQKGGSSPVTAVLDYGERITAAGLNLLNGPGNDIVSATNLAAAGCHLILFTTGRGTPLGAPVPTIKIASRSALAALKPHWIDFDAGQALTDPCAASKLFELMLCVASGQPTRNEENGYREIAILKDGVTL